MQTHVVCALYPPWGRPSNSVVVVAISLKEDEKGREKTWRKGEKKGEGKEESDRARMRRGRFVMRKRVRKTEKARGEKRGRDSDDGGGSFREITGYTFKQARVRGTEEGSDWGDAT